MSVAELRELLKDLPEDIEVMMLEEGGHTCHADYAFTETDDESGRLQFWISH